MPLTSVGLDLGLTGQSINRFALADPEPVPRTPEHIQRLKDERREEILLAALRVFARKGLAATKISDIAAAAGLSHGLVYHYFESKDAVYAALLLDALEQATFVVEHVSNPREAPLVRLRKLLTTWLELANKEPEVLLLILQGAVSETLPKDAADEMARFHETFFLPLVALMEEGQRKGSIVKGVPAGELTATFIAMLHGLTVFTLMVRHGPKHPAHAPPPDIRVDTILRLFSTESPT